MRLVCPIAEGSFIVFLLKRYGVSEIPSSSLRFWIDINQLSSYGFTYGTVATVVILGIVDDTFDIRWRHKFFIPAFASLPTLALYFVDYGITHVTVPVPLRPYVGELVDLGMLCFHPWPVKQGRRPDRTIGILYYVYMFAVSIFCPNSINIVAGVNGIEVAQSVVIAFLILINDSLYIWPSSGVTHPAMDAHLFSTYLLIPFVGVSLALLKHNWYPARVFVGDTYCYFAGVVFATVGILGHFSKTLLLLFIPQIFNFIYSVPQLAHIVPCPRHRLPKFNVRSGLLEPSKAEFTIEKPLRRPVGEILKVLHRFKLLRIEVDDAGRVTSTTNFTVINLWLVWRGPMREDRLVIELVITQSLIGLAGLWARQQLPLLLFTLDNR